VRANAGIGEGGGGRQDGEDGERTAVHGGSFGGLAPDRA
jgi:hypothetical protein